MRVLLTHVDDKMLMEMSEEGIEEIDVQDCRRSISSYSSVMFFGADQETVYELVCAVTIETMRVTDVFVNKFIRLMGDSVNGSSVVSFL